MWLHYNSSVVFLFLLENWSWSASFCITNHIRPLNCCYQGFFNFLFSLKVFFLSFLRVLAGYQCWSVGSCEALRYDACKKDYTNKVGFDSWLLMTILTNKMVTDEKCCLVLTYHHNLDREAIWIGSTYAFSPQIMFIVVIMKPHSRQNYRQSLFYQCNLVLVLSVSYCWPRKSHSGSLLKCPHHVCDSASRAVLESHSGEAWHW